MNTPNMINAKKRSKNPVKYVYFNIDNIDLFSDK